MKSAFLMVKGVKQLPTVEKRNSETQIQFASAQIIEINYCLSRSCKFTLKKYLELS